MTEIWRALCHITTILLVIVVGVDALIRWSDPVGRTVRVAGHVRHGTAEASLALAEATQPTVMFIGNSRTLHGIRPARFDAAMAGTPQAGRSANLAVVDAYPSTWYLVVRTLLERPAGKAVKTIIIGACPEDWDAPITWSHGYDMRVLSYGPADFPLSLIGPEDTADMALGAIWRLWRHRKELSGALRLVARDILRGPPKASAGSPDDIAPSPDLVADYAQGFRSAGPPKDLLRTDSAWPCKVEKQAVNAYYFDRLLSLCESRHIQVHVVWLPEFWEMRDPKRHSHMRSLFDFWRQDRRIRRTVDLSHMHLPSRYWHDHCHMTAEAATLVTDRLAAALKDH
jgi:hypothetical protein